MDTMTDRPHGAGAHRTAAGARSNGTMLRALVLQHPGWSVALLLFALRTEDPHTGAQLSALAQTVGYIAGGLIGPFAVGVIYDWSASWVVVEVFYVAVGAASLVCGLGAGRALTVAAKPRPSRGP